jgi:D-alanyl-D-alanine carboxypeptidase
MFTATATLQLVQAGKLTLNDPLGKYLTDYPNKDVATKVTLHQLLTHTGGTGDIFTPEFEKHRLELRTLQDYEKLYGSRAPEFEPGSRWEYSNYGFVLLGLIIEKVSGQSYYDYVRDHVFQPAGMTSTASDPEDAPVANRSVGYTKFDPAKPGGGSAWRPNTDTLPYRGTSAGGGYSTVEDLLRFANALESHKLLDVHYTDLLATGKVDTPRGRYAYGFGDDRIGSWRCDGHGGGAPGMNGDLKICTAAPNTSNLSSRTQSRVARGQRASMHLRGNGGQESAFSSAAGAPGADSASGAQSDAYVIAVLSNLDPPAASRISDFIANRLPQH